MTDAEEFADRLLAWFKLNRRSFLWRQSHNPFHILVAEVLLKKTRAENVDKVIGQFLARYGTPEDIQGADIEELTKDLVPLGLYNQRAKHLKELSCVLIADYGGRVPNDRDKLISLPGIGDYTANAVLCFAYGDSLPIIDTNVVRIFNRILGLPAGLPQAKKRELVSKTADRLIVSNKTEAKDINFALLDLGAKVCKPVNPSHGQCPVSHLCLCFQTSIAKH